MPAGEADGDLLMPALFLAGIVLLIAYMFCGPKSAEKRERPHSYGSTKRLIAEAEADLMRTDQAEDPHED